MRAYVGRTRRGARVELAHVEAKRGNLDDARPLLDDARSTACRLGLVLVEDRAAAIETMLGK